MQPKELKKTLDQIGLSQSDLARLIFNTSNLKPYQRIKINRYISCKSSVPHWLPVILKMYINMDHEQRGNIRPAIR